MGQDVRRQLANLKIARLEPCGLHDVALGDKLQAGKVARTRKTEVPQIVEGQDDLALGGTPHGPSPSLSTRRRDRRSSEYPAVVIPVLTQHYAMLQRNLLYTGVTRGKRLVVLVGQKKAVAIAVRNVSGRRRWSKLDEWLGEADIGDEGSRLALSSGH